MDGWAGLIHSSRTLSQVRSDADLGDLKPVMGGGKLCCPIAILSHSSLHVHFLYNPGFMTCAEDDSVASGTEATVLQNSPLMSV